MTPAPLRTLRAHRPEWAVLPGYAVVAAAVLVLLDHGTPCPRSVGMPVDVLVMDQRFLADVEDDPHSRALAGCCSSAPASGCRWWRA